MEERSVTLGKRTKRLVWLMQETGKALTDRELPPFPGEKMWTIDVEPNEWERYCAGGPEPRHWQREAKGPPTMRPPIPSSPALSLEETLSRLGRVRRSGNQWKALCPAHEDRNNPSLIVSENKYKPGEPRFFCYVGCTHQEIKASVMGMK